MKNIHLLFTFLLFASLFFACEKDSPIHTKPIDEEPTDPFEGLLPYRYQPIPVEGPVGHMQAIIQDSFLWEAGGAGFDMYWHPSEPDSNFGITFYTVESFTDSFFLRQKLTISEIPRDILGSFDVKGHTLDFDDGYVGASFATLTDDGDVLEEIYIADASATDNKLTVEEIDEAEKIYRGTFTISFIIKPDRGKINSNSPDRFTLRNAVFNAKIL